MADIKVSIIIPVYNVEKYLKQCLDSVVNQTLTEIEVICVDDGSTDNSLQILGEYAEKDDRIRVISKENGGIASARNKGMEYATGEYIGFVDSDDWITLDMYEKLYENAKFHGSDMVMCPAHIFDYLTHELRYDLPYFTLECFDETFDNRVFNHEETTDFFFAISVTAWNKLYKSKFLEEKCIKFNEGLDFEDNTFFYETYLKACKVSLVRDFLYYYRINRSGSFITSANERFFDIVEMFDLTEDVILKTGNQDRYMSVFSNFRIPSTLWRYDQVAEKYKAQFFEIIKENFKKMNPVCIDSLDSRNTKEYQNIIDSSNYKEYELMKRMDHLVEVQEKRNQQWQEQLDNQEQNYKKQLENQKRLQNEITAKETVIQGLEDKIKRYEWEINAKNQLIHEITSSNSWKLMKPLRTGRAILKKRNL